MKLITFTGPSPQAARVEVWTIRSLAFLFFNLSHTESRMDYLVNLHKTTLWRFIKLITQGLNYRILGEKNEKCKNK